MADIQTATWTETASGNSATPPNGMPEGQSAASVNDGVREIMGAIKREYNRSHPVQASTGSGAAYLLTYTVAPDAWADGLTFAFWAHAANSTGATLAPALLAAKVMYENGPLGPIPVRAGSIKARQLVVVSYSAADDRLVLLSPSARSSSGADIGDLKHTAAASAPAGWLFCAGQAISRTTYADLFSAIGTAFGTGDGSTTFNLPDARGRTLFGRDNMGGTAASRLTVPIDGSALGASGGHQALQAHTHGINDPGHGHTGYTDMQGVHAHTGTTNWVGDHTHGYVRSDGSPGGTPSSSTGGTAPASIQTDPAGGHNHTFTTDVGGGHNHIVQTYNSQAGVSTVSSGDGNAQNIPPGLVVNTIIFTGVFA